MNLREAIDQQINLGYHDPREIAQKIAEHSDRDWLAMELLSVSEDVISDMARAVISSNRRTTQSLARRAAMPKRELMLEAAWLPGLGWVQFGTFTAEMFDRLALQYSRGAEALARYAAWCESNAALMREQGVELFKQVRGSLPELPLAEVVQ